MVRDNLGGRVREIVHLVILGKGGEQQNHDSIISRKQTLRNWGYWWVKFHKEQVYEGKDCRKIGSFLIKFLNESYYKGGEKRQEVYKEVTWLNHELFNHDLKSKKELCKKQNYVELLSVHKVIA